MQWLEKVIFGKLPIKREMKDKKYTILSIHTHHTQTFLGKSTWGVFQSSGNLHVIIYYFVQNRQSIL